MSSTTTTTTARATNATSSLLSLSSTSTSYLHNDNRYKTSPQWIEGRRCLIVPSKKKENRNEVDKLFLNYFCENYVESTEDNTGDRQHHPPPPPPPIIILGGMAQSISSWEHHLSPLSRERDVVIYEYLGSGLGYRHEDNNDVHLVSEQEYYQNVTLSYQAKDFCKIIQRIFPKCQQIDVVGFSLGARIALATIALYPTLVRKAHLTGVCLQRTEVAKIIIQSWKDILSSGDIYNRNDSTLKAFARSIILATYSEEFLEFHGSEKVALWVDHICQNNNPMGLLSLLEQTHDDDQNEMINVAKQIQNRFTHYSTSEGGKTTNIQIHIGCVDRVASPEEAKSLNNLISSSEHGNDIVMYEKCGHAVMNEDGRKWRKNVISYLSI